MASQYQYSYLARGSIRVLNIIAIEPRIVLAFEIVTLDSNPKFNALSYTWGEPVFSKTVFIGDDILNITPSLHDCLKHLGQYVGTKIWIDALCINQSDNEEKSHQVQGMARVYKQASKVIMWLGVSADDSDQAMKGIATYGQAALDAGILDFGPNHFVVWPDIGDDIGLIKKRDALIELMKKAADAEGDPDRVEERLPRVAFAKLTHRNYFTRVWVKQEITLSSDTAVICGKYTTTVELCHALVLFYGLLVPWEIGEWRAGRATQIPGPFSEDELLAAESPWELQKTTNASVAFGFALSGRRKYKSKGPEPLYRLLQQSYVRPSIHILDCQDPRDRIWGLSGLAKDMVELGLQANYDNSKDLVYEATARALLGQGHIDILKWCRSKEFNSPSWAPDWASPILYPWSDDTETCIFKSTGTKSQPTAQSSDTVVTPGSIRLQGVLVGSISEFGSIWEADPEKTFSQVLFKTMVREILGFLKKSRYTEDQQTNAIWRIPIGDKELPESNPYFVRATTRSLEQFNSLIFKVMDSDLMAATYSYQACLGYNAMARPIISDQGFVGLGPSNVQAGDLIVLLLGGSTPFILRPRGDQQDGYLVLGEAYVYDIMDGELVENLDSTVSFELW